MISKYLKEDTLLFRPNYQQKGGVDVTHIVKGSINPQVMLREMLDEKYHDEKVSDLAVDLLDKLSKNDIPEAEILSDTFYDENYESKINHLKIDNEVEESDNVKESNKVEDFNNLQESNNSSQSSNELKESDLDKYF